jgi:hypothetical protein
MTASRPRAALSALGRAIRRVAVALWTAHAELVLMCDPVWQAGLVPADRDGPLAWTTSPDGPQLIGSWLPAADETGPAGDASAAD